MIKKKIPIDYLVYNYKSSGIKLEIEPFIIDTRFIFLYRFRRSSRVSVKQEQKTCARLIWLGYVQ